MGIILARSFSRSFRLDSRYPYLFAQDFFLAAKSENWGGTRPIIGHTFVPQIATLSRGDARTRPQSRPSSTPRSTPGWAPGRFRIVRRAFPPGKHRHVDSIPCQAYQRAAHPLVLPYLVLRCTGPLFRSQPQALADFAGIKPHRRFCPLSQHDGCGGKPRPVGFLARLSPLLDAVLCLQLRRPREGPGLYPHLLAQAG